MADLHLENSSWLSYGEIAAWPTYSSMSLSSTLLSLTFWSRSTKVSTQKDWKQHTCHQSTRQTKLSGIKWLQALSTAWPPHTFCRRRTTRPIQCLSRPHTLRDTGLLNISYCAIVHQQALQALHADQYLRVPSLLCLPLPRTSWRPSRQSKKLLHSVRGALLQARLTYQLKGPTPMRKPCDSNSRCAAFKTSNGTKQLDLKPAACGC